MDQSSQEWKGQRWICPVTLSLARLILEKQNICENMPIMKDSALCVLVTSCRNHTWSHPGLIWGNLHCPFCQGLCVQLLLGWCHLWNSSLNSGCSLGKKKNRSRSVFMFVYRCFGCQIWIRNILLHVLGICFGRQVLVPSTEILWQNHSKFRWQNCPCCPLTGAQRGRWDLALSVKSADTIPSKYLLKC